MRARWVWQMRWTCHWGCGPTARSTRPASSAGGKRARQTWAAGARGRAWPGGTSRVLGPDPQGASLQSLLVRFDACLLSWTNRRFTASGTSASKMFDYLYSARPVINAYSGAEDFVSAYDAGLQVPAGDPDCFADAVRKLYDMSPDERASGCQWTTSGNSTFRLCSPRLSA